MKKNIFLAVVAAIILIAVLAVFWIGGIIMGASESVSSASAEEPKYIVILGGSLEGKKPGRCLENRIEVAAKWLKEHPEAKAVCSGGQGADEEISEAEAISKALWKKGIAKKRIILEEKSTSTYENFAFTKTLLDRKEMGKPYKIAFATNEFHIYRSKRLAEYVGFEKPVAISAPTPGDLFYQNFLREIAAVVVSWVKHR